MFQEPVEENLKSSREWNGTTWNFCSPKTGGKFIPGQYQVHKPSQCKGTTKGTDKGGNISKLSGKCKKQKKMLIKEAVETIECGYVSE